MSKGILVLRKAGALCGVPAFFMEEKQDEERNTTGNFYPTPIV